MAAVISHMVVFYLLAQSSFLPALDSSIVDRQPITDELRAFNSTVNNSIAFVISNLVAYFLNVIWVFVPGRHQPLVEFGLFTLVSTIAFIGGLVGGPLLIKVWGINTHLSQLLFVFGSVIFNSG